jgi:hypothetical protein
MRLRLFERSPRTRIRGRHSFNLTFLEPFHAMFLSQDVHRAIATDREQPLHRMPVDRVGRLAHEFDERILHNITRTLRIAE